MNKEKSAEDNNKILFANLIMMLASGAMQQMGKLINPGTNKTEMDLEAAQATIDIIAMLQAKTKDSCDDREKKMVADILSSLQMNYVETAQTAVAGEADKKEDKDPPPEQGKTGGQATDDSGKDPKFHKSYGN